MPSGAACPASLAEGVTQQRQEAATSQARAQRARGSLRRWPRDLFPGLNLLAQRFSNLKAHRHDLADSGQARPVAPGPGFHSLRLTRSQGHGRATNHSAGVTGPLMEGSEDTSLGRHLGGTSQLACSRRPAPVHEEEAERTDGGCPACKVGGLVAQRRPGSGRAGGGWARRKHWARRL